MARIHQYLALTAAVFTGVNSHTVIAEAAAPTSPSVTIKSGIVVGFATQVISASSSTATAYNYLGIPFAAPPTGTGRFAPPVTPTAWASPLQAAKLPPACFQQFNAPNADFVENTFGHPGGPPLPQNEDCLYLNVYAPTDASPTNKKAVLFWIFGGDLQFGSGSLLTYNGSSFAAFQDVVVVTSNYRTNIFGFSNSPEIPVGLRNSGFLDQRLALQWVQDNIAQFGGDPAQVTIFGESAGGWSVKQLLAQPPAPLPFRAAIMESQAASFTGSALANYNQVLAHFNRLHHSHQWANVPFFLGTNADEGRVFAAATGLDNPNTPINPRQVISTLLPNLTTTQNATLAVYPSLVNNAYLFTSAVITDLQFTCTTSSLLNFAVANGFTAWRYYYNSSFPNEATFPNAGAYHSSEILQVFGTYSPVGATTQQQGLSAYMQKTWANFAKNPSAGPGWPKLGSNGGMELGQLGGPGAPTGEQTISLGQVDYACAVFDPVIAFTGF